MRGMHHAPAAPIDVARAQVGAQAIHAPSIGRAPASRARHLALGFSAIAVTFSLAFGYCIRHAFTVLTGTLDEKAYWHWIAYALGFLTIALLLRMGAALCELLWLERTWSNLPEDLQKVGPVEKVSSGLVVGISFVPGVAWIWKLGLIVSVTNGFEELRARHPFRAPVPKTLGRAAIVVGWVPGLNMYVAPFLWELFARRMERVIRELMDVRAAQAAAAAPPASLGVRAA